MNGTIALRRFLDRRAELGPLVGSNDDDGGRCGTALAQDIEEICGLVGISKTRFCRDAAGQPGLYHQLKFEGLQPGRDLRILVLSHINRLAIQKSRIQRR